MSSVNFEKQRAEKRALFDVKSSGERLLWRFSKTDKGTFKAFTPNDNDYNALMSVLGFINRQSEGNVSNNQLFAKLYIHFLTQGIRYHGTTVFDVEVHSELHRLLKYPLALFYKAFITDLYGNQFDKLLAVDDVKEGVDVLKDVARFKEVYSEEFIISRLDEAVNKALNMFS